MKVHVTMPSETEQNNEEVCCSATRYDLGFDTMIGFKYSYEEINKKTMILL